MSVGPTDDGAGAKPLDFVTRGGLKLAHALDEFRLDVRGMRCADFGCNIGGFTDCLLSRGAATVVAIDTGYGALAWKLRNDPRVNVMERTNALHAEPAPGGAGLDLVVIDMGWTPQRLCIPAAVRWLGPTGQIVSLVKPHYELLPSEKGLLRGGVLAPAESDRIAARTIDSLPSLGVEVVGRTRSPIAGGAGKKNASGNTEWLALLRPVSATRRASA